MGCEWNNSCVSRNSEWNRATSVQHRRCLVGCEWVLQSESQWSCRGVCVCFLISSPLLDWCNRDRSGSLHGFRGLWHRDKHTELQIRSRRQSVQFRVVKPRHITRCSYKRKHWWDSRRRIFIWKRLKCYEHPNSQCGLRLQSSRYLSDHNTYRHSSAQSKCELSFNNYLFHIGWIQSCGWIVFL